MKLMYLDALTTDQQETLICLAHNVVVSDGELDAAEKAMMDAMRREMSLPENIEARYVSLEGIAEIFDDRRSRAIAIIALVRLSYADGAYEIEERCYLDDLRKALDITGDEFDRIQAWVRRLVALEHDAQALLA